MESLPSDTLSTTGTGVEPEVDLEDVTYSLMEKSGLMSSIKSQILKFIETNGNLKHEVNVIPERANPVVLSNIYEYLKWIGLNNTCMNLLAEAPVPIDIPKPIASSGEAPALHKMFSLPNCSQIKAKPDTTIGNIIADPPHPVVNSTYDVTRSDEMDSLLLKDIEVSNKIEDDAVTVEEVPETSANSYSRGSDQTEDVSVDVKVTDIPCAEHIVQLNKEDPITTSGTSSVNEYSDANNIKTPAVNGKSDGSIENTAETQDKSVSIDEKSVAADEETNVVVDYINRRLDPSVFDTNAATDAEGSQSQMSSIAEDSEIISDMSVDLNTEDISIPSNLNGMSAVEHQIKLN